VIRPAKRQAFLSILFLGLLATLVLTAGVARTAPSSIESKQAQAQQVLAQIQDIDGSLGLAVEAYNAAQIKLDAIEAEQRTNTRRLEIARRNYARAQEALSARLVALYTSNEESVIEVLLGASSLDDLVNRLDTVDRVSQQDARIVNEVRSFRAEIKKRERELAAAREQQARVVADRAARKQAIEGQLAQRQELLASIKDQIAEIRAAEAAEARELADQTRQNVSTGFSSGGGDPPGGHTGVVGIAMRYLGIPYRWGGASPSTGFDCSGFIMYVYAQVGVSLPHNAAMQYGYGSPVSRGNLQPGDLVFFNSLGHNGIYVGNNAFIHSPHTGDVVKISSMTGWYDSTYVGARRL
jgi:cell wall-associated NlpC family hydrolase